MKQAQKNKKLKIALLSSFTINGLEEALKEECKMIAVEPEFFSVSYGKVHEEMLQPKSRLKTFTSDMTFLCFDHSFVFGDVVDTFPFRKSDKERARFADERMSNVFKSIDLFLKSASGLLIVSNLPFITYSPFGIQDEKQKVSLKDLPLLFNVGLKERYHKNNRVFILDQASFFSSHGERAIVNDKLRYLGEIFISPQFMPAYAQGLMRFIKPFVSKSKKCIVLDLDNTLWGGIVGEDGFDGIKLGTVPPGSAYRDFQRHLLALKKRGIILAINSKNNQEDALKVIREHPSMILREDDFASIQINWKDKVTNMRAIAEELNISSDSFVFFDDDELQRELIKKAMPEVLVPNISRDPSSYVRTLKDMNDFETLQMTDEDFKKGEQYAGQRKANTLKSQFSSMDDFLKDLHMEVELKKVNSFSLPRVAQLIKKTNQFNLTTKRYSEEDVGRMSKDSLYLVYSTSVKDKFVDHGLVGVFILQKEPKDAVRIDSFLLSCRVIGREVEAVMMRHIADLAQKLGAKRIVGEYIPTEKNSVSKDMFTRLGFAASGKGQFVLSDFKKLKKIEFIKKIV